MGKWPPAAGWLKELLAVGPSREDASPAAAPARQPLRAGTSGDTQDELAVVLHAKLISQAVETKRLLLDEALSLDDLNDRMASALDDIDT